MYPRIHPIGRCGICLCPCRQGRFHRFLGGVCSCICRK